MKDAFRCLGLLLVGLVVASAIYPFLHECGHFVMSVLVGAKVIDFNLFPVPYVTCEVNDVSAESIILIGFAGMFVPALISMIIRPKSFWLWYADFVMRGICLLSFIISLIAIVLYRFGITIKNEDIVQIISIWDDGVYAFSLLLALFAVAIVYSIKKQNPLNRIMVYFEV